MGGARSIWAELAVFGRCSQYLEMYSNKMKQAETLETIPPPVLVGWKFPLMCGALLSSPLLSSPLSQLEVLVHVVF